MLKRLLVATVVILKLVTQNSYAGEHNLNELIQNDREERIQRINDLTIELNKSLTELNAFRSDLEIAIEREKETHTLKLVIRNGAAAVAAIGFVSTVLYQSKGINPNKVILAGGYALSTISTIVSYMENRSIHFTKEEIEKIRESVKDIEGKIEIEKRNLAREIRLLCLSDGGSPEVCDQ